MVIQNVTSIVKFSVLELVIYSERITYEINKYPYSDSIAKGSKPIVSSSPCTDYYPNSIDLMDVESENDTSSSKEERPNHTNNIYNKTYNHANNIYNTLITTVLS